MSRQWYDERLTVVFGTGNVPGNRLVIAANALRAGPGEIATDRYEARAQRQARIERAARDVHAGNHGLPKETRNQRQHGRQPHATRLRRQQAQARPGRRRGGEHADGEIGRCEADQHHP